MANVLMTPEAAVQALALPTVIRARIEAIRERLTKWPEVSGAKPLSGNLAGHWRIRTGDYRVQFRIDGETIVIEKVGHRDRFYQD